MPNGAKHWCFTINNPDDFEKDGDNLNDYDYCILGQEIGDDGTPHVQGYIAMKRKTTLRNMKILMPRAHLEMMRGSSKEASDYCKKDGNFIECGDLPVVGGVVKARRYKEAIQLSKAGDFDKMQEEHPDMYWNNYHTMKRIRMDNPDKLDDLNELNNEWIWGPPRIGKSRMARAENPNCYIKPHNKWFLGYKNQEVVLYDDLGKSCSSWIGDFLKQWGDHYPFPIETKGDGSVIRPKRIIITSNYSIDELFGHDEQLCLAIKARFKTRHIVQLNMPVIPLVIQNPQPEWDEISINDEDDEILDHLNLQNYQQDDTKMTWHIEEDESSLEI